MRGFLCLILEETGEYLNISVYGQWWLFRYLTIDILIGKLAQVFLNVLLSKLIYLLKKYC